MLKHLQHKLYIGGTVLLLAAGSALAQDTSAINLDTYRVGELSVDGFGTASIGKYTIEHLSGDRVSNNTRLGGGLGLDYFFTHYLGVAADAYTEDRPGAFIHSTTADLVLRFPLGQSGVAPYVLGGGGYRFDETGAWIAEFGAGLEYRFTPHWGVFGDARVVVPNETRNYGLARLGVSFSF